MVISWFVRRHRGEHGGHVYTCHFHQWVNVMWMAKMDACEIDSNCPWHPKEQTLLLPKGEKWSFYELTSLVCSIYELTLM